MPNPRVVTSTVSYKFSDLDILQRVAEKLDDGSMAFKVDIIGGLSLSIGDINIGAVNILNASDVQINPATDETLQAILAALGGSPGSEINKYDEQLGVASAVPTDIVTYTVPAGKTFRLRSATASCNSRGEFEVLIDAVVEMKKRTSLTEFNVDFVFPNLFATAGQVVKIVGTHIVPPTADMNASLHGELS